MTEQKIKKFRIEVINDKENVIFTDEHTIYDDNFLLLDECKKFATETMKNDLFKNMFLDEYKIAYNDYDECKIFYTFQTLGNTRILILSVSGVYESKYK